MFPKLNTAAAGHPKLLNTQLRLSLYSELGGRLGLAFCSQERGSNHDQEGKISGAVRRT